ncbi:Sensor kinase CusS [Planctomycetes bacterium Poly30]|uniref:histidine kinase n=1 Tax=Saltatorellus ferox TaxID=2528018 RepID=A0A518F0B4_9BACT|nr:Sensor kinase CusS [Planctomycetes bacterium Poly30]
MNLPFIAAIAAITLLCTSCDRTLAAEGAPPADQVLPLNIEAPVPGQGRTDHLFQCWLGEGVTVARSRGLNGLDLPRIGANPGKLTYEDIELPDGEPARAVAVSFYAAAQSSEGAETLDVGERARGAESHPVEVVIARSTRELEQSLRLLRWILFATWGGSMLACAGVLGWLVRRGLSPLRRLSKQINDADQEGLDRTFELAGAAEELEPVVNQLNGFVERIREAFEREHAFTAHAAHELRTPLAGLRSTLEVSLSQPREAPEYVEAERECLRIALQLQRLVERLLELARAAEPNAERREDTVDLLALVDEAWLPLSDAAAERGVSLELDVPEELVVTTDRQLLLRVLQNVLENASVYADAESSIEVTANAEGEGFRLTCSNEAQAVTPGTAENAFDPFWRSDSARTATGIHAGLGLALCKGFVDVLGGKISIRTIEGRFTMTIEIAT